MNNVHILHLCNLYNEVVNGDMFHVNKGEEEIKPYLITNKGYLLLPCLMIPHKQSGNVQHIIFEALYNKHLSWNISDVEIFFSILKKSFWNLLLKTNLHVLFLLDVIICRCIMYNMILGGKDFDIEALMVKWYMQKSFSYVFNFDQKKIPLFNLLNFSSNEQFLQSVIV